MKIVLALGGNALGDTPERQKEMASITAKLLIPIMRDGHELVITHGNGPQVGLINMAFSEGAKHNPQVYEMPFPECGAMSQAYIAYHLLEALRNELKLLKSDKKICQVLTSVLVDKNDPAFDNPTKPIGPFYTYEESLLLPYPTKEDSNRGYRRVVASPKPKRIIEDEEIMSLLNENYTVICLGGGGIPTIEENGLLRSVSAVIDKDYASSVLASNINADLFIILTQVSHAKINFGKEDEKDLSEISLNEAKMYLNNKEFKKGSMEPKVESCISFLENTNKEKAYAVITDLAHAKDAISLKYGTIIHK